MAANWILGDNRCCGLYSSVGQFLASQGIGAVLPNYRLSPGVKHPAHIEDVAQAIAWTKKHIGEHGGRADRLFLVGHSAGGHLVALLATDERYLNDVWPVRYGHRRCGGGQRSVSAAAGLRARHLGRPVADSLPRGRGGAVRDTRPLPRRANWSGVPLELDVYGLAFGDDPKVRAEASPINHVYAGLPPFLLVNAENDLPTLPDMANAFHKALAAAGCDVRVMRIARRNHNSVMFHAVSTNDPVARYRGVYRAARTTIRRQCTKLGASRSLGFCALKGAQSPFGAPDPR